MERVNIKYKCDCCGELFYTIMTCLDHEKECYEDKIKIEMEEMYRENKEWIKRFGGLNK